MPVVFCKVHDDGDKHRESLVFVLFQNVEEVIVLKEAHGAVCHLQVIAADRAHDPLEEALNERLYLLDFADFKNLLQLRQEEGLLHTVGKWPVLKQTFKEGYGKGTVLSQEEHRAAKQLLVELTASLYFVQRNVRYSKRFNDARFKYLKGYWQLELDNLEYELFISKNPEEKELHSRVSSLNNKKTAKKIDALLINYLEKCK